jgi:rhodanese-related sulfurtransferase
MTNGVPPVIDHDDFLRVVAEKTCIIIDVREPNEYAAGHVPGAINKPLSRFSPETDLPRGEKIVIICQAGGRSAKALKAAMDAGFSDICHYAAGTGGWRSRGGTIAS